METNLYSLVYCSRNLIKGTDAEVTAELLNILASARKHNPAAGLTGALLFSAGNFAQLLEGPLEAIERTFERIQFDPRHGDVTVVCNNPIPSRLFPDWAMAFAGSSNPEKMPLARAAFSSAFANAPDAAEKMLSTLTSLVQAEDEWIVSNAA